MTNRPDGEPARSRRRHLLAILLGLTLVAGLPAGAVGRDPAPFRALPDASATVPPTVAPAVDPPAVPPRDGAPPDPRAFQVMPGDAPSQMYLDLLAAGGEEIEFVPGGRVTVPFVPRADDSWPVGGTSPRPLPAGLESGAEMAGVEATPKPDPTPSTPATPDPTPGPTPATPDPTPETPPDPSPIPAVGASWVSPGDQAAMAPAATSMRREVYGFLPYWEVGDSDTRLDFSIVTHLAYFSVGADGGGNLRKRESSGSLTTGWAGWTSSGMTSIINAAHQKHSRVTLTISVFAWTAGQVAVQKALLGSASARLRLARQAVAAVRDRGADGINLDFEPLVSGYEDEFVALVRTIRSELNKVRAGYHLSFDTLGFPGNYPLEAALAPGGADTVFIMGYDYRTAGAGYAGSIDPLAGPAYDLTDTVRTYTSRVSPSKVILGIPYYGRAWSTVSEARNARTQTGAKYGYSNAVNYTVAVEYAAEHGRRYDSREVSAWTAYRRSTCSTTYGCVMSWRQIYYDDAATLKARYDLVNRSGLRGAGIWALGYDGTRRELYQALADKFLRDTTPPAAEIVAFPFAVSDEGFQVRWSGWDDWSGIASYDVQVSADGGPWKAWINATTARSAVWLGQDGHGYAFRVRARDGKRNTSAWNVTSVYAAASAIKVGGFVRVTATSLNLRSSPSTTSTLLETAAEGDILAVTRGPVAADDHTWYEVTGPVTAWRPVAPVFTNAWIAASGGGDTTVAPARAPNATRVQAMIRAVTFDGVAVASAGRTASGLAARAFSPNGDGSEDRLTLGWSSRVAFDSLELRLYRPDGTSVGVVPVAATGAGAQAFDWDARVGGTSLPDGAYVPQLVGTVAGATYTWPSASPVTGSQPSRLAITIDRVRPGIVGARIEARGVSPNGDGRYDAVPVVGLGATDVVRWEVVAISGDGEGSPVRRIAGTGRSARVGWDGRDQSGKRVPDGRYRVSLRFFDAAGNVATRSWSVRVDATPPTLAVAAAPTRISPNGDGSADTVRLRWTASEAVTGVLRVTRGTSVVRSWRIAGTAGAVTWDGRDSSGRLVADGAHAVTAIAVDALANRRSLGARLVVDRTAGWLRWSPSAFHPQDGDRLAATAAISARLSRPARVTLRILDATGVEVRRPWSSRELAAGTAAWRWDGRTAGGAWAPQGRYVAELTAISSLGTTVLRRSIQAGAFVTTLSSSTPAAGSRLSVTFRSVEPLASRPAAYLRQAGRGAVPMTVTRLADGSWRASLIVAAGAPGRAVVSLVGRDTAGGTNRTTLAVTVR